MTDQVDLFDDIDSLPQEVQDVLAKHQLDWEGSYNKCNALVVDLEKVGYTCEYYLDAIPYNLKKL